MRKWIYGSIAVIGILLVAVVGAVLWSAQRTERPVGFQVSRATNTLGKPFAIAIEAHSVPGAGHLSFLAPCRLLRPPALCQDEDKFDRAAFHRRMNADVVGFFNRVFAQKAGGT